jgi:hypothetical protein
MKPPDEKRTRPSGLTPRAGCCEKRPFDSTPAHPLQGVTDPLLAITTLWMRLGARARSEFLADVRAVYADLWDHANRNSTGGPAT